MELSEMLYLALKVIADWRVVFITVAVLVVFAILRYVGLVYHRRPRTRARPPSSSFGPPSSGGGRRAAGGAARAEASEEGSGSDLIE
jgi:hypothetical protein